MKTFFFAASNIYLYIFGAFLITTISTKDVVDFWIKNLAYDTKTSCLMTVLSKISSESTTVVDATDFTQFLKEGVQQSIDLNTMLLQYQYFKKEERDDIAKCQLNLNRATARCESIYGECKDISYGEAIGSTDPGLQTEKLPFITRNCPDGFLRYGCCKCERKCDTYPNLFILDVQDTHNYCLKKPAITSELTDQDTEGYEPIMDKFVKKCPLGWARVGLRICVPKCPLGWPDHGDRCMKQAGMNLMPFVWQPGDEN